MNLKRIVLLSVLAFVITMVLSGRGQAAGQSPENATSTTISQCSTSYIDNYLSNKASPLAGSGENFVSSGQSHNVDPRLVIAVAGQESGFGTSGSCALQYHNAWGYGGGWPNCWDFSSWAESIEQVTWQLWEYMNNRGLTTIHDIGGTWCAEGCENWETGVKYFYEEMGGNPNATDLTFNGACSESSGGTTVLVESPTLTPAYNSDICTTGWFAYNNNIGYLSYLTIGTNDPNLSTNSGVWRPNLPLSGNWKVEAYIPTHSWGMWPCGVNPMADSTTAQYAIHHSGGIANVTINQAPVDNSWVDLGIYSFTNGTNGYVHLSDLTNDPNFTTYVSFSAMRFTYQPSVEMLTVAEPNLLPPYTGDVCATGWYRYTNNLGYYAYLTVATNDPAQSTNHGEWFPNFPQAGSWKAEAYIPTHSWDMWPCGVNPQSDTSDARYLIHHDGGITQVSIDQAPLDNTWTDLGTYTFSAGESGYIHLADLTSDPNFTRYVSFSAMRFTLMGSAIDTTMPYGYITSPVDFSEIGQGNVTISANANDNPGGSGIKAVYFWAMYADPVVGADWYLVGGEGDTTYPYGVTWVMPTGLRSQVLEFGIHVEDNQGNYCIDPGSGYTCYDPSSKAFVTYFESLGNPNVHENWISSRYYLNQLALGDGYDLNKTKCNGASAAMMLAMTGKINGSYERMRDAANNIWSLVRDDARAEKVAEQITNWGLPVQPAEYLIDAGWAKIKQEIDQNHPVILLSSKMTTAGHYIVIVGYHEEGNSREIIAYDPFGRWTGTKGEFYMNGPSTNSFKGQWAYYDLDEIWGKNTGWWWNRGKSSLITIIPGTILGTDLASSASLSDPDIVSSEPNILVHYEGIPVGQEYYSLYLPVITR